MKQPKNIIVIIVALAAVTLAVLSAVVIHTSSTRRDARASTDAEAPQATSSSADKFSAQVAFHEARVPKNPDDAESYRRLAAALNVRAEATGDGRDYDRALDELAKAEKLEPGSLELLLARSVTLLSRHRFAEARAAAEHGLNRAPNSPDFIGLAGDGALQSGDLAEAERYYQRLAEIEPKKAGSWTRVAYLAEVQGDLDRAAELMEKAINVSYPKPLSPANFAWARAVLGEIKLKRGRHAEARRQYRWALAKSPDHPLALEHLAELDEFEGDYQAAEANFRRVLELAPSAEVKLSLAKLLERRGKSHDEVIRLRAEARTFCEQAVASGNEGYLRPLAAIELEAGNYARAAELAARDMALRPTAESRELYQLVMRSAAEAGQRASL